jgi:hypothetical protein
MEMQDPLNRWGQSESAKSKRTTQHKKVQCSYDEGIGGVEENISSVFLLIILLRSEVSMNKFCYKIHQ